MVVRLAPWFFVALLACSSRSTRDGSKDVDSGTSLTCEPHATRSCVGPGACTGGQICADDGSGWSSCDCGTAAGGTGGDFPQGGSGGSAGSAQGGSAQGGSAQAGSDNAGSGGTTQSGGSGGSGGCEGTELFSDPSFDEGLGSWASARNTTESAILGEVDAPISAHSSPNLAWLGGYDLADDWISQTVTVNQPGARLTVSFWLLVDTLEFEPDPYDLLEVQTTIGDTTETHGTFDNRNASTSYAYYEVDLPPVLAGTTMTVTFMATTDGNLPTAFFLDSLSLRMRTCDP